MTEVNCAALRVGQTAVLEDLQQDVEDVRVSLLDLVEQQHRVRLAAHCLCELSTLVVTDVAGRRTDEPRDSVLLHVLRHVDADHRVVVAEQELGKGASKLGFTNTRWAEEDERAGWTLRILKPCPRTAHCLRDNFDSSVLADHALVEFLLHAHQLLSFGLGDLEDWDTGPHRDDVCDFLFADRWALCFLALLPGLLELLLLLCQLALFVAQASGGLELLVLDCCFLGSAGSFDFILELAVNGWCAHRLDPGARGCLVDQVDRLVWEEPLADVAIGKVSRRLEGFVSDLDLVVCLVTVTKATQNLNGLLCRGLVNFDLLEAALKCAVALEVLAVLVKRGRADGLQLATGECWLQNRSRVNCTLCRTGTDKVVDLVNEQDDVSALGDLLHHLLQALLKLTAVLGTCDECRQVERVDLLATQQLWDI